MPNGLRQIGIAYHNWTTSNPGAMFQVNGWNTTTGTTSLLGNMENNGKILKCPSTAATAAAGLPATGVTGTSNSIYSGCGPATTNIVCTYPNPWINSSLQYTNSSYIREYENNSSVPTAWIAAILPSPQTIVSVRIWNYNQCMNGGPTTGVPPGPSAGDSYGYKGVTLAIGNGSSVTSATWSSTVATTLPNAAYNNATGFDPVSTVVVFPTPAQGSFVIMNPTDLGQNNDGYQSLAAMWVYVTAGPGQTDYGINAYVGSVSKFNHYSNTILALDYGATTAGAINNTANAIGADWTANAPVNAPGAPNPVRHAVNRINVLYLDGHVESPDFTVTDSTAVNPNTASVATTKWLDQ